MEPAQPTPDAETSRPTSRRFRFSILTLLLLTAIVALLLAYFRSRSDLVQAQARLNDIRQTYQLIDVQDAVDFGRASADVQYLPAVDRA